MQNQKTLIVLAAAGLLAPIAVADPADLSAGQFQFEASAPTEWFGNYIADLAGPSNFALSSSRTEAAVAGVGADSLLLLAIAGPSHIATDTGPRLSFDASAFAGPDDAPRSFTTADYRGSLQPADVLAGPAFSQAQAPPNIEPGEGSFQVVVPLPGAGALAAGGLVFVAIRRRR